MRAAESDKVQAAAAIALLDHGFGKPAQSIQSTMTRVDPDKLTDAER
jgi:hypothetical protein